MFKQNFLYFSFCFLPLVLLLDTSEKSLAPSSLLPSISYLYTLMRFPPEPSFLQAEQYQISKPLIIWEML